MSFDRCKGWENAFLVSPVAIATCFESVKWSHIKRWQPTLTDGRRLYQVPNLRPEFSQPSEIGGRDRRVLYSTPGKALDATFVPLQLEEKRAKTQGGKDKEAKTW